jgi:hypothetical protein
LPLVLVPLLLIPLFHAALYICLFHSGGVLAVQAVPKGADHAAAWAVVAVAVAVAASWQYVLHH